MTSQDAALLVLADGTVFRGRSIGARGMAVGEVVFNTAITGYQEILTDPSYCRQLVTLTYPHIGNIGVNDEDTESSRIYAEALIVRDVPRRHSSWRAYSDLSMDLAKVVSVDKPYEWTEGRWEAGKGYRQTESPKTHVVAYDYGIKRNILRLLAERGSRVTVVPATTPARRSAKSSTRRSFRCSASALAISSWGSPRARRP